MKKLFLMLITSVVLMTACNDDKKTESDEKMGDAKMSDAKTTSSAEDKEEQNKKTALASVEAISSHNADQVLKDAAADVTDYGDGSMAATKGIDSIKAGITHWFAAFPDVKGENLKAVADGDWVMVWGDWSGTWKGDFMGQKATGKSYKIKDVDIFKFNDEGKVTEHHNIQSWMPVAQQIGMKMK
jgi:predicted ester cyclase